MELRMDNTYMVNDNESSSDEDLLLILHLRQQKKKIKGKKRLWVHPILQERERTAKGHLTLLNDLLMRDDEEKFLNFVRLTKAEYVELLSLVRPFITKKNTNFRKAISPELKLALTLRYLGTGMSMAALHYEFRVGHSTVSQILSDTMIAIYEVLSPMYLQEPQSDTLKSVSETFRAKCFLPNCIGALDGKHVRIQCPYKSGSQFYNYKNYFSLILLAACDANYKFIYVDVGAFGSESDGGVFARSDLGKGIDTGKIKLPDSLPLPGTTENFPFFFVADEAFPLCSYIMRPFPGNRLSEAQKIFNYRLSTARRLIENTFGILVQRFRIFRTEILAQPEKVKAIIIASVCLHNFIISTRGAPTDNQELSIGSGISQLGRVGSNNSSRTNQDLRNRLMDYFLSVEGAVPWQREKALRGIL